MAEVLLTLLTTVERRSTRQADPACVDLALAMFNSGVLSVRAAVALSMGSSVAWVSSNPLLPRRPPLALDMLSSKLLPGLFALLRYSLFSAPFLCRLLQTSVLRAGTLCKARFFGTGVAPAAMRKMSGPYMGTGHATLLAAMCGALTSHGITLPALGLTPGHKELPGEQVGLGQLHFSPTGT